MYTHTHPQSASAGSRACNHLSNLEGEFYRARRDRYLPICLPVSTSNKSREQETRQHRQVAGRSAAPPFDVCKSAHQCVVLASSRHGGSPPPHPEQHTADCLAVGASGVVVFRGERTDLFRQAGLRFFNRAPAPAPRRPAQADTLMIRRGTRPNSLLLLLPLPVLSSRCYCIFINRVHSSTSPVAFLMGRVGKKVQAKQPRVPRGAVVKWYTARKHKVRKCELSHESIAAFRARSWLRSLTH